MIVHNCRNEAIDINKNNFFYKHFLIYNPKLCSNQAIKVTKSDFFLFLNVFTLIVEIACRNVEIVEIVEMKK